MNSGLSASAQKVIQDYLHLPFPGRDFSCPYYNNQRTKVRAALRVLVGKGSAEDIVAEAQIISLRDKINLDSLTDEVLKRFLVEQNIGIDCSALAYYILDAECRARGLGPLGKHLKFPYANNPLRRLLIKLRPVENAGVNTLAHETNSLEVALSELRPGDMIIMLNTGFEHRLNHILVVHEVEYANGALCLIRYTHSFKRQKDGQYGHGVRQGVIEVVAPTQTLAEQHWQETGDNDERNETLAQLRRAKTVTLRRLRCLETENKKNPD